jgi:DNA polymerase-1
MRAMALFTRMLADAGIPGGLILVIHDELVAEIPEAHEKAAARLLEGAMTQAFAEYFPNAPRKGLVDVQPGKAWGDAKS